MFGSAARQGRRHISGRAPTLLGRQGARPSSDQEMDKMDSTAKGYSKTFDAQWKNIVIGGLLMGITGFACGVTYGHQDVERISKSVIEPAVAIVQSGGAVPPTTVGLPTEQAQASK